MNPHYWVVIASIIEEHYEDNDGFVVLHGSDTMSYSASALSFMLEITEAGHLHGLSIAHR